MASSRVPPLAFNPTPSPANRPSDCNNLEYIESSTAQERSDTISGLEKQMQFPPQNHSRNQGNGGERGSYKPRSNPAIKQSDHYCLSPSSHFRPHPIPLNFPLGLARRRRPIFTPFSSRKHNFSVGRLIACAEKLGGETEIGNWIGRRTEEGRKEGREREGRRSFCFGGKVTKATAVKFGGGGGAAVAAAAEERKKERFC